MPAFRYPSPYWSVTVTVTLFAVEPGRMIRYEAVDSPPTLLACAASSEKTLQPIANTADSENPVRFEVTAADAEPFNTPVDTLRFPNGSGSFDIVLDNRDDSADRNAWADVGVRFELTPFRIPHDDVDENLLVGIQVDRDAHRSAGNGTGDLSNFPAYVGATGVNSATGYTIFSDDDSRPTVVQAAPASDYRIIGDYIDG